MRRVNLLPPEERRRRSIGLPTTTTRTGIIGVLLIAGALSVMLMIGLYLLYYVRSGNEEDRISQLDDNIARQRGRIGDLAPYSDLRARLNAKKPIADGIFRTRFSWDEFLRGLAFVIPDSTALDVFDGKATPINAQAPAGGSAGTPPNLDPPGTITFDGVALPEYQNVSDFILRMDDLSSLANATLTRAGLDRTTFSRDAVTFEVNAQLVTKVGQNGDEVFTGNGGGDNGGGGRTTPRGNQASLSGAEQ